MKYRINEIFSSVQAEGGNAGRPAVFVRLSGCNLHCPWCDTPEHFRGFTLTSEELEEQVMTLYRPGMLVVFTGGEPTLQLSDYDELLPGTERAIETNGTRSIPHWIDYVACSPKTDIDFRSWGRLPDEIKVVCESERKAYFESLDRFGTEYPWVKLFMQPLEQNGSMNGEEAMIWVLGHPQWRLSVQFHKFLNIR